MAWCLVKHRDNFSLLYGVDDEIATYSSISIIDSDQYFVFMSETAENPISHKYIVTKGSTIVIALSDKQGYEVYLYQTSFKEL
jgi:hypothetical protein